MACTATLDIGKTSCRLIVFDGLAPVWQAQTAAPPVRQKPYPSLDVDAVWSWLLAQLKIAAQLHPIEALAPIAHGATAALIGPDGHLAAPILDYEVAIPEAVSAAYDAQRPAFAETGSPSLPVGLNLGRQLAFLESADVSFEGATITPYPQYWAFKLSGVLASDVSSLGCHTDLWAPGASGPSTLAQARGWDARLAPVRPAGEALGAIRADVAQATGLSRECVVLTGAHDSNAALFAVERMVDADDGARPITLSTGTWSIAFAPGRPLQGLPPERDTLVNVAVDGEAVPSSRYMAGREFALLAGDAPETPDVSALQAVLDAGAMAMPNATGAGGPFPNAKGGLVGGAALHTLDRSALASLSVALAWDAMIDLIAPRETERRIVIEGPASRGASPGLLAALRPRDTVVIADAAVSPALGGAMLAQPDLDAAQAYPSTHIAPFALTGLETYAAQWREHATASAPDTEHSGHVA